MKTITIKAFSACDAVRFFDKVNPFMFHDEILSCFRRHPEWYFMDPVTGNSAEVVVKVPDNCVVVRDLDHDETSLEFADANLFVEYVILGGVRIPAESARSHCCFLERRVK